MGVNEAHKNVVDALLTAANQRYEDVLSVYEELLGRSREEGGRMHESLLTSVLYLCG